MWFFPGALSYLSNARAAPRATSKTAASDWSKQVSRYNVRQDDALRLSLTEIEKKLLSETIHLPKGFRLAIVVQSLIIHMMAVNDEMPAVASSVTLYGGLKVTAVLQTERYFQSHGTRTPRMARCKVFAIDKSLGSCENMD
jgi:hypothetical protein